MFGRKETCIGTAVLVGLSVLALAALGVGPGQEVIVPDATWIATSALVDYVGAAESLLSETDPHSWAGSFGDVGAFSFHDSKTGEGCMLVTGSLPQWRNSGNAWVNTESQ